MVENYITLDDIQCFRSPTDFVSWFSQKLDEINSGVNVREQILLRRGIAKLVFEEVYPLYRLLQNRGSQCDKVNFRNVDGDQNFDVETTSELQVVPRFIEITVADNNYEEHLRMRYFVDHGRVSAVGKVSHQGTKKTGLNISVETEARLHAEINREKELLIREAVDRKCTRNYANDTGLLIYFDDYVGFNDPHDTQLMSCFILSLGDDWMDTFSHLFVVGATGSRVWSRMRGDQGVVLSVANAP